MAKKEDKKPAVEREYTIPLRERCRPVPRYRKTPKAVKTIKEFLVRHMKIRDRDLKKIKIDGYLNNVLWARGIKSPPHKIKVKAIIEEGIVKVELADIPKKIAKKKEREEKREARAMESVNKKKAAAEAAKKAAEAEKKEKEETEEKKTEEKEKKSSVVEAGRALEKAKHKEVKHQVGGKVKQPKRPQRKALAK